MTTFRQHKARWKDGCGSQFCRLAGRVCLARGTLPADVAFVGEAPGPSEDVIGSPFVGPAGQLLDRIIARALPDGVTHCLTNLVGCIPRDPDTGNKWTEPDDYQITKCAPRLAEFLGIARPRLVVAVGKLAKTYVGSGLKSSADLPDSVEKVIDVYHPAYILRSSVAAQSLLVQQTVVAISNAAYDLFQPTGGES